MELLNWIFSNGPAIITGFNLVLVVVVAIVQYRANKNPERTWEDDALPYIEWASNRLWNVSEKMGGTKDERMEKAISLINTFKELFKNDKSKAVAWAELKAKSAEETLKKKAGLPAETPQKQQPEN